MRRLFTTLVALLVSIATGMPALASTSFEVLVPASIQYNPATDGFAVTGISVSNAPNYIQIGLTLTDTLGAQVEATDAFRVSIANQCTFDSSWTNSGTGGSVIISGDDTTNVLVSGNTDDVVAAVANLWIYRQDSAFCSRGSAQGFGQNLLTRNLRVTAVESQPGLFWSPSTQHYYMLATQTADDGMGQPTDDSGNITDPSRYFVRWSTARAEAKSASITIGGNTHAGYLAAITTKDEFGFLNNNVSGGSGVLYPAWVGGSDAGSEGTWNWVDGPEALNFGGDTLEHSVTTPTDHLGNALNYDGYSYWIKSTPTINSWTDYAVLMRDQNGDPVVDQATGYIKALNSDAEMGGTYCSQYQNDQTQAWIDFNDPAIGPEIDTTPYGSTVRCDLTAAWYGYLEVWVHPVLVAADGTEYVSDTNDPATYNSIYLLDHNGSRVLDDDGNFLVARPGTSDFITSTNLGPNYYGATFWGQDSTVGPGNGAPDYCTHRGVRGICQQTQQDVNTNWQSNNYFVYWSNGNRSNVGNWDGTGAKPGDGAYSPQPDNAGNEDALIINWCTRNASDYSNSTAITQSLYGNSGYHCTPGWNDLPAGDWATSQSAYSGAQFDTPNQIGTTDYVIEFCGYDSEATCANTAASASVAFTLTNQGCPQTTTPNLSVSYAGAHLDSTDLSSPTMLTETFDNIATGWMPYGGQMTAVGYLTGTTYVAPASPVGGSGGVGNYPTTVDSYLTLPTTECYLGFWWSAGNSNNNVDFLDSNNNVLASFNANDLVAALGSCPSDYCGNPNDGFQNGNELYAYVHMRLPSGFNKVHFYGAGFELDNISFSVSVPGRATNETNLSGQIQMSLDVPPVVLVDPRATIVEFPGLRVSGDTNATLCFRQVADDTGTPLIGNPSARFENQHNDPITTQTINDDFVASGSTTDVEDSSVHLLSSSLTNHRLAAGGSLYFSVSAAAGANPNGNTCDAGTKRVVEIRPISLDLVSNLEATFARL